MRLQSNVRVKKFPWTISSLLSDKTAHAIYPNIYLPKKVYINLTSERPDAYNIARLIHEQTHIQRQKAQGFIVWSIKYAFNKSFRFEEEIRATRQSMKFIKSKGLSWNIENTANHLSSWLYLRPVTKNYAKNRLESIWKSS